MSGRKPLDGFSVQKTRFHYEELEARCKRHARHANLFVDVEEQSDGFWKSNRTDDIRDCLNDCTKAEKIDSLRRMAALVTLSWEIQREISKIGESSQVLWARTAAMAQLTNICIALRNIVSRVLTRPS
jgi:hypothetical protein